MSCHLTSHFLTKHISLLLISAHHFQLQHFCGCRMHILECFRCSCKWGTTSGNNPHLDMAWNVRRNRLSCRACRVKQTLYVCYNTGIPEQHISPSWNSPTAAGDSQCARHLIGLQEICKHLTDHLASPTLSLFVLLLSAKNKTHQLSHNIKDRTWKQERAGNIQSRIWPLPIQNTNPRLT